MSPRESDFSCPRRPDAAAYVLGALEDNELRDFRAHMETCAHCRAEVVELQVVVDELPASAPAVVAPEAMRERIMATVRAEAELLSAAGGDADKVPSRVGRWRKRRFSLMGAGFGVAAGVAALIAILIATGSADHGKLTVIHGVGEGNARTAQVSLRKRDGRAELVVAHMPQPALGRIYEVWLSRTGTDAKPTNALFSVTDNGSGSVDVPNSLKGIKQVMVTSEPAGGSLHPTMKPLIRVVLASA
jgi:anti-sigma-K factor RskA